MTTNEVTANGLITQSLSEIISELQTALKSIYGNDINLESNSPDGQMVGIYGQLKADLLDVITDVYNSMDPDVAEGSALDARSAINGIQRIGGTYTIAPVSITTDRAMTIYGLDQEDETVFTVADNAGNQFYLETTQVISGAGTASYNFRAVNSGTVQVQQNTITSMVTIIIGVTAVNNPASVSSVGSDEETDADFRLRRQGSLAIASSNSLDALRAAIANLDQVTDVYLHENDTGSPDDYSVPGHTIWVIVEGGAAQEIGDTIYKKRSAGCSMQGGEEVSVERPDGTYFTAKFDRPNYVPILIQFYLTARQSGTSYDPDAVKAAIVNGISYKIFDKADAAGIGAFLTGYLPDYIPSGLEIEASGGTWEEILDPDTPQDKFTLSADNITILSQG